MEYRVYVLIRRICEHYPLSYARILLTLRFLVQSDDPHYVFDILKVVGGVMSQADAARLHNIPSWTARCIDAIDWYLLYE
jgi:hypothetical protein